MAFSTGKSKRAGEGGKGRSGTGRGLQGKGNIMLKLHLEELNSSKKKPWKKKSILSLVNEPMTTAISYTNISKHLLLRSYKFLTF